MKRLAFLALALAPMGAFAQLVTNGSFETGSFSGWTETNAPSGSFIEVTTGYSSLIAESGAFFAAFGASYGTSNFDSISQTISTSVGATYTLTFWIGGSSQTSSASNLFQAKWDGTTLYNAPDPVTELGNGAYVMTEETYQVTGTGSDVLLFQGNNGAAAVDGLDNIVLTPSTPEPVSMAAFAFGGAALLRRRRKS